ncbi:hypothetical protein P7C70_g3374, partial [Phenoliferia sp. Uapishka_3]
MNNIPFNPESDGVLPTSLSQTRVVCELLITYISAPRTVQSRNALITRLSLQVRDNVSFSPAERTSIITYYSNLVNALHIGPALAAGVADPSFPSHALLRSALITRSFDDFDASASNFFKVDGGPRVRRRANSHAPSDGGAGAEQGERDDEEAMFYEQTPDYGEGTPQPAVDAHIPGLNAAADPLARNETPDLRDRLGPAVAAEGLPDLQAFPNLGDNELWEDFPEAAGAAPAPNAPHGAYQARERALERARNEAAARQLLVDMGGPLGLDQDHRRVATIANAPAMLDLFAQIDAYDAIAPPPGQELTPIDIVVRARQQLFIDTKSLARADPYNLYRVARRLRVAVDLADIIIALTGEGSVDLRDVRDHLPVVIADERSYEEYAIGAGAAARARRHKAPFDNFFDYLGSWDEYHKIIRLVYPERIPELDRFRVWMRSIATSTPSPTAELLPSSPPVPDAPFISTSSLSLSRLAGLRVPKLAQTEIEVEAIKERTTTPAFDSIAGLTTSRLVDILTSARPVVKQVTGFVLALGRQVLKVEAREEPTEEQSEEEEREAETEGMLAVVPLALLPLGADLLHGRDEALLGAQEPTEPNSSYGPSYSSAPPTHVLEGIDATPRLLRTYHWPAAGTSLPTTPLLTSSFYHAPLPRPPASAFDAPRLALRASHPTFFRHDVTINLPLFKMMMADHPNRPFVESLEWNFENGWWPCHDGFYPKPLPASVAGRLVPLSDIHNDFIQDDVQKEIDAGWVSPGIKVQPPNTILSEQFVAQGKNSRMRRVCNQTKSNLNGGIDRANCPVVFDSPKHLIALLRHLHHLDPDVVPLIWKLDESSAFRIICMHWTFQAFQWMAVSWRIPGSHLREIKYHCEWRATFGGRANPYLFIAFQSCIVWIGQNRLLSVVPSSVPLAVAAPYLRLTREGVPVRNPYAYMDDLFSLDCSGQWVWIHKEDPTGDVSFWGPPEQAAMCSVWDELGVPWSRKKAESGEVLVVCGIKIDSRCLTASLPDESIDALIGEIDRFLSSADRRCTVHELRVICGWANWALTVWPYLRPCLQPCFTKLSYPNGAARDNDLQRIYINSEMDDGLTSFRSVLSLRQPLDLLSTDVEEWDDSLSNVVIETDACLVPDAMSPSERWKYGGGSGFGAVLRYSVRADWESPSSDFLPSDPRHIPSPQVPVLERHFSRADRTYLSIIAAEAVALVWAILRACHIHDQRVGLQEEVPFLRMLAKCDNAAVVFAFDRGNAVNRPNCPLRDLVRVAFEAVNSRGISLRVVHVAGALNVGPDALSRRTPSALFLLFGGNSPDNEDGLNWRADTSFVCCSRHRAGSLSLMSGRRGVSFAPLPTQGPKRGRIPMPPLADLIAHRSLLLDSSLQPSTRDAYERAYRSWGAFVLKYDFPPLPTENSLSLYVAWRWLVGVSTYSTLSGLAWNFKPLMVDPSWETVRSSTLVLRTLVGGQKRKKHRPSKAPNLRISILRDEVTAALASKTISYNKLQFLASTCIQIFCCGRASEATRPDNPKYYDESKFMRRSQTTCTPTSFAAFLPYHKADPKFLGSHYFFLAEQTGETIYSELVFRWITLRDQIFGPGGFLFLDASGRLPLRRTFVRRLKALFGPHVRGHSPRGTGAGFYVLRGWSNAEVMRQGRWTSAAWEGRLFPRESPPGFDRRFFESRPNFHAFFAQVEAAGGPRRREVEQEWPSCSLNSSPVARVPEYAAPSPAVSPVDPQASFVLELPRINRASLSFLSVSK